MLLIGSAMQVVAFLLYLFFDRPSSHWVIVDPATYEFP